MWTSFATSKPSVEGLGLGKNLKIQPQQKREVDGNKQNGNNNKKTKKKKKEEEESYLSEG